MTEVKKETTDMQTPTLPEPPKKRDPFKIVQAELPVSLVKRLDDERLKGGKITRQAIIQWGVEAWLAQRAKSKKT